MNLTALQKKYAQVYCQWVDEDDPIRKYDLEFQLKNIWTEQREAESRSYPSIIKSSAKVAEKAAAKALKAARKRKESDRIDIYDIYNDLI